MIYAGIDIGKEKHCIAVISEKAEILLKPVFVMENRESFESIDKRLRELSDPSEMKVGMEASGHYWTHFFRFLTEKGWTVELINPVLTNNQARRHLRGRKTDKDDAVAIAKVVRDGDYDPWSIPSRDLENLKYLCRSRSFLIQQSSDTKRHLTSLIDQAFPEIAQLFSSLYQKSPLAVLKVAPTADAVARMTIRRLTTVLSKASKGHHGLEMAQKLHAAAKSSVAFGLNNLVPGEIIQTVIEMLEVNAQTLKKLEDQIDELFKKLNSPIRDIPGIGPVTGSVILAEAGDLKRFKKNYRSLLAYAGLDPRVQTSGKWVGVSKMSKRGSKALRTAFFQAASMGRMHDPSLKEIYDRQRKRGKHHHVAISHVARKLVQLVWVVCRNNQPLDPAKISAISA